MNRRGLPMVYSGNFACVFKVTSGDRDFAVRCFTREVKDQEQRYGQLDEYLRAVRPDNFVNFEYLDRGIRLRNEWYPIVKMAWVDGVRLDKFVESHLDRPHIIQQIAARWRGANGSLRGLTIAHNDLQHGNVMVQKDEGIRLVDYDGIFLPRFRGEESPELGHQHYQHPLRALRNYDETIDNFPSLVLYLSLLAVSCQPDLFTRFYNQENLIFTKADFAAPDSSECFKELKRIHQANVSELATLLAEFCSRPVEQVPDLESILNGRAFVASPTLIPAPAAVPPGPVGPAAPPAPLPAAPSPTPVAVPSTVTESEFRRLILTDQIPAPPPVFAALTPTPSPGPVTPCPICNEPNSASFIYCANENCLAVILPGRQDCKSCHFSAPVNAFFCPECGIGLTASANP